MGIDYGSMMIVGVRASYVDDIMSKEDEHFDIGDWVDENGLTQCFEHYDADLDSQIVGIECSNNISEGDLVKFLDEVAPLFDKVRKLTGLEPKLIASQNIW